MSDVSRVLRNVAFQGSRKDVGTRTVTFELVLNDGQENLISEKDVIVP